MHKSISSSRLLVALTLILVMGGCSPAPVSPSPTPGIVAQPLTIIPLDGPVADRKAELSGLAWCDDSLILLPQYPSRFGDNLFALSKADIVSFLDGVRDGPLVPREIPLNDDGLSGAVSGFEGFEAVGCLAGRLFVTVESRRGSGMMGYLVGGSVAPGPVAVELDAESRADIPPQADLSNYSDEALVIFGEQVLTFYEANGVNVNSAPVAHRFGLDSEPLGTLPFPHLEYRVTDGTAPDADGRFWVVNYLYPGDRVKLNPVEPEPLTERYGFAAPGDDDPVERLVELQYTDSGIVLSDRPPLWIVPAADGESRNWEGVVRLDERGFLLATDTYPKTILAFVPKPN